MDPIERLEQQHEDAQLLFRALATTPPDDQQELFDELAQTLFLHTALEEQVFYPTVDRATLHDLVHHAYEDHARAKGLLARMAKLDTHGSEFQSLLVQLRIEVEAHVAEERTMLFPAVRGALDAQALASLGEACERRLRELSEGDELPTLAGGDVGIPAPS